MADSQAPVRFDIRNYQVEGNTLIPSDTLSTLLVRFTGPGKDFATVKAAAESLQSAYRTRGLATSVVIIPEQEFSNGVVRLQVIESRLAQVKVEGNRFFNEENIRRSLPALRTGEPINTNDLSTNLKLANENPAKQTSLKLANSGKDNDVAAIVNVTDNKFWKVGTTFDNTGDQKTGRYRQGFLFQHANVLNRDQQLSLQYITSPTRPERVSIYGLGYLVPVYAWGSTVDFSAAYSDVDSGTLDLGVSNMQVSGKGTILGLHYNQNLPKAGRYEHQLSLGLDYRGYQNSVDFEGTQLGNDVTVHPVSLTYAGTLTVEKLTGGFYVGASLNLPGGWAANDRSQDFETARADAPERYSVWHGGVNITYNLIAGWQARAIVNGQYTDTPLVPGEQYGLGGANSVRGFREREFTNDRGYSGSLELYTPNMAQLVKIDKVQCRALAFYDFGQANRVDPLPDETTSTTIASVGPGLRITDGKNFSLATDYGFIVDPADGGKGRGDGFWHFRASVTF